MERHYHTLTSCNTYCVQAYEELITTINKIRKLSSSLNGLFVVCVKQLYMTPGGVSFAERQRLLFVSVWQHLAPE